MAKCSRCNGSGYVAKHENCEHSTYDAYINGCNDSTRCRKCHGFGITGTEFVKQALLELSINSTDIKSRELAKQALREWESIK